MFSPLITAHSRYWRHIHSSEGSGIVLNVRTFTEIEKSITVLPARERLSIKEGFPPTSVRSLSYQG